MTTVEFCGINFKNPVISASGTVGFGRELSEYIDLSRLGGISTKGLTLEPRTGNKGRRIHETPSGLMNSIGLQNPGVQGFIDQEWPFLMDKDILNRDLKINILVSILLSIFVLNGMFILS